MPLKDKKSKLEQKQQTITGLLSKVQQPAPVPQNDIEKNRDTHENLLAECTTSLAPTDSDTVNSARGGQSPENLSHSG